MAITQTGSTCILPSRRDRNVISNANSIFLGTENSMAARRMLPHVSGSQKSNMAITQTGSTCILTSRQNSMAASRMLPHVSGSQKSVTGVLPIWVAAILNNDFRLCRTLLGVTPMDNPTPKIIILNLEFHF
jgi:hypothetical protein